MTWSNWVWITFIVFHSLFYWTWLPMIALNCSYMAQEKKITPHRFWMTRGWINNDRIFIFGWNVPSRHVTVEKWVLEALRFIRQIQFRLHSCKKHTLKKDIKTTNFIHKHSQSAVFGDYSIIPWMYIPRVGPCLELTLSIPSCDVLCFPAIVSLLKRNVLKLAFCLRVYSTARFPFIANAIPHWLIHL